jgi:hypothetical protein
VARRSFAVVLATMLTMVSASPLAAQKKIERRMALGMEGAFRIMNMVGSVVVHGWSKDTVLIRGTLAPGDQFYAGGGYTGAKAFVESADQRDPRPTALEIWVPSRARVWVKTATANIDVDGVEGGLDLYVVSGKVDVTGNPKELNAEAIDGDIHISGSPSWLRAKSASGTITLRGGSADAGISTVSGAVKVEGGAFERTKIETVTGNVSFAGQVDRSGAFDFDTHSGAIDIAIPERTNASFSIVTIAGNITNNVNRSRPTPGRFGRGSELTTEAGDGGAKVSVRSFKGSVTLRRSK